MIGNLIVFVVVQQFESEDVVSAISLGDDDFGSWPRCTPAKRNLDAEFAQCQMGYESIGCSSSAVVEDGGDAKEAFILVQVRIEKDQVHEYMWCI